MWNENLEELIVVKRSGQRVEFNASKIAIAIKKAYENTFNEPDEKKVFKIFEKVLCYINNNYKERKTITVEDIQDIIEKILKESNEIDVYNSFNEYRNKRAASRKVFTEKQQHKFLKAVEKVQEHAKESIKKITPNQMLHKFGKIISSEYAKSYILDNKYVREFEEGNIFIHNLEYFSLGIFSHFNYKINDKNEKIEDIIYDIKNASLEVNEKILISIIDYRFEPYILKEYQYILKSNLKKYFSLFGLIDFINFKKYEELINKIEKIEDADLIFNNVKTNENIELIIKKAVEDAKIEIKIYIKNIITLLFKTLILDKNNSIFDISLGDNDSFIGKCIKNEIINYLANHDSISKVCVIFKLYKNEDEKYLNDICNLIINNKNILIANMRDEEEIIYKEYFSDGIKSYESYNFNSLGKLQVSSTSINLARLALKNKDINNFYKDLYEKMQVIKNQLLLIFEYIGDKTKNNYEVLFNGNVYDDEKLDGNQKIRKVIKSGILNIGIIGMTECVKVLETNPKKQEKLLFEILKKLNDKCKEFSEETKIKFCLFEPSDKKSRQYLMKIDKSIYGTLKGITDKDNYLKITNLTSDYKKLEEYLNGGILIEINLPANTSLKRLLETINQLNQKGIGLVKIKVGKL